MTNDPAVIIARQVADIAPRLIAIRRDLHAHPELGFDVGRTAGVVSNYLMGLGLSPRTGIGRSGVVTEIKGGAPGPTLLLRADMDALPIDERTGLAFASLTEGRMHACGHDIHTVTLLGAASILTALAPRLRGTVRLVFQPAEETVESGAAAMIADGAADGCAMALAFHNRPGMPAGRFGITPGASTAASDEFDVIVRGASGHAAYPNDAIDPIVAAALIIAQLQTIVSREVDPSESAVVTIGQIAGGATHNIIPDSCMFRGTVRTRSPAARDKAEAAFRRICEGGAMAMNVRAEVAYQRGAPPLMNDPSIVAKAANALRAQFGEGPETVPGWFGAEDFSYFSERLPSAHVQVGSSQPGRSDKLHNSDYQPDEACIGFGVAALTRIALDLLA